MLSRALCLAATFCVVSSSLAQTHLMRYADVHQDQILFTYEGDLWLAPSAGGDAKRITSDDGDETWAKFSPDGTSIAFTGQYDGGRDVYIMQTGGSAPVRLTYHPSNDRVVGWTPDGSHVLFRARREYPTRAENVYKVSTKGGMPVKLPVDRAGLAALSPDGSRIAYNRLSREERTWKRHQGGTAQDIWMGSLAQGDFRRITDWVGTDNYPMWHGDGIYFNSDRAHGTLNLFRYDVPSGRVEALTDYQNYDVKHPSIGPQHIVYQHGESLHLLNLATRATRPVSIRMPSDRVRMRPEFVEVDTSTGSFSLSPSGKRLLIETRGEILNVPAEDGDTINLTRTTATREKNAAWSPDGKWVAFLSDRTGEEEIYLIDQKGEQPWRQLTSGGAGFRLQLKWSPDSQWLVFSDKHLQLNLVNAETGELTVIDRSHYDDGWYRWGIQDYSWSPDSKWIAYSKLEQSINEAIFIYSMKDKSIHRITDDMFPDWSPSFDPQGRYLYFLSGRSHAPIMGAVDQNYVFLETARPYVVLLKKDAASPFAPKDSEEEVEEGEDQSSNDSDDADAAEEKNAGKKKDKKREAPDVDIDFDGIEQRILVADGIKRGNFFRLEAIEKGFVYLKKDEHEFEKYQAVHDGTSGALDLYTYDLDEAESTKSLEGIANYHLSADGKKLVYRSKKGYGVVEAGGKADAGDGMVDLDSVRIEVDRRKEFLQIFDEAWRVQRDWFYDPDMHGVDWAATKDKYRKLVADCGNRSDLNYLIGEMISELNIGHTYVFGGDIERTDKRVPVGLLGAEFESNSGFHRIKHIYAGRSWNPRERSPLNEPGCPIKVGHYLIAIDGQTITSSDNICAYLQNKRDVVVSLTYNDAPTTEGARTHRVKTIGSESSIQYREWVERNRQAVDRLSGGTIGYLHIPNMGRSGLIEFAQPFHSHYYKKGFIIDERYNGGGFTSGMIIDRLERRVWALTQPREGKYLHEPERAFHGHWVVLVNEDTGSAGEWFAERIKRQKLAPIIGMRTWGGVVGIELHQPLVDGGGTTPPQFGPYGLDGKWMVEGHGVDPDIEVQNEPKDVLQGKDRQLERAVQEILNRLKTEPMEIPSKPVFPDKSKSAMGR